LVVYKYNAIRGASAHHDVGAEIVAGYRHVLAFVSAYNFAKYLKALRWKTPFEAVCHAWTATPEIFKLIPRHLTTGLNT